MTSSPSGIGRVPHLLRNQTSLALLGKTNAELFKLSQQLSTGLAISRPSDDPIRAASISVIDDRLERSEQVLRNLEYATGALSVIDNTLTEAQNLVNEAKSIASAQISTPSSASEREAQANVVDSLIQSLFGLANQESVVGHIFGGTQPGKNPVVDIAGAYQYVGGVGSLQTDIGSGRTIPVTLGAQNTIGATSARVEGSADLDPDLTLDTRLADLGGAQGLGVTDGVFELAINGGTRFSVGHDGADTVGDVVDAITAAIEQAETDQGVSILGAGGVSISGEAITIDVPAGSLEAFDTTGSTVGADLGLVSSPAAPFNAGNLAGADLAPRVGWTTPISALSGITPPLGEIQITNNAKVSVVDLSGASTLSDIRSLIESGVPGTRVELSADGRSIDVVTEIAGGVDRALSITEVAGNNSTATQLGIRSYMETTALSDFNDGRGVEVLSGATDPVTGLPDPARDVDFSITLWTGTADELEIDIDLQPEDIVDVGTMLAAINAQADAALTGAGYATTDFEVQLPAEGNGLELVQSGAFGGSIEITRKNNSLAPEALGLLDGSLDGTGNVFTSSDRAKVRVDNLFTHLIDLRDALRNNDTTGIQFASTKIEEAGARLSETHGLVGGYAKRVDDEIRREEDRVVLDETTRSSLRDTDCAEAATRLSLLQSQLQATYQVTASTSQLSLLNFLS
ncbi:MAG: flagellin [Phycisphaerales bacterium JB059]